MIVIAIGANLPGPGGATPLQTCQWAVSQIQDLPGLQCVAISRWYRSAPEPPSGQPDYVNGAILLDGPADPAALLAALHGIEAVAGRVRGAPDMARTLDLDIIAVDDLVRTAPDPVLPHPRAHRRGFVLRPLCDVWPAWVHPVLGQSAAELVAALPSAALPDRLA